MNFDVTYQLEGNKNHLEFHTHSHLEIYYFHGGECNFQVDNHFYSLIPGDLLLIDGMKLHKAFVNQENKTYKRSLVHFEKAWISEILEAINAKELLNLFASENGFLYRFKNKDIKKKLDKLFFDLNHIYRNKDGHYIETQLQLLLIQLLVEIDSGNRESFVEIDSEKDEKLAKVEDVVLFLVHHHQKRITLSDIAKGVNISKSYLSHLFKEVTGTSVMNFLMGYRLTQSKYHLVLRPSLTISEVSSLSGFESNAHFSRFFKKHAGISPLQFRKQNTTNTLKQ